MKRLEEALRRANEKASEMSKMLKETQTENHGRPYLQVGIPVQSIKPRLEIPEKTRP